MPEPDPPQHFVLALFPGVQLLDVTGPLDILNLLSLGHSPTANITLTILASTLDPVPTKPIPPIDPSTSRPKWTFPDFPTCEDKINTSFSQSIVPTDTYSSFLASATSNKLTNPIDVLFIPGGVGTRVQRKSATGEQSSNIADLLSFIPKIAPHVRHSILTVCTGSDALAQTGLLDSRRATTNMTRFDEVAARSPRVKWLKARRWVRSMPGEAGRDGGFHGEIWTSAGVSAGMDVTFAFVEKWYGGKNVAKEAAKRLEYDWRDIAEGAIDPMYGEVDPDGLSAKESGGSRVVDQS